MEERSKHAQLPTLLASYYLTLKALTSPHQSSSLLLAINSPPPGLAPLPFPFRRLITRQRLRKLTLLSNPRSLPIENVNRYCHKDSQHRQYRTRPLKLILRVAITHIFVKGRGVHGRYTGQEIAGEAIAAGCGGGVRAVCSDHIVYCGYVDSVVGDADEHGENHGGDPVHAALGAETCPGEAEEADGFEGGEVEEPVEAGFRLKSVGIAATDGAVAVDEGKEGEVGYAVADYDGDEGETDGRGAEVPLLVDWSEGFEEGEDEGVGEAREEGETENDGFAHEHFERAGPDDEYLLHGKSVLFELVGPVYVGLPCFASLLR